MIHPNHPSEITPLVFSLVVSKLGSRLPRAVFAWLADFACRISPAVPVDLRNSFQDSEVKYTVVSSFLIALFFCFFITGVICWIEGTFFSLGSNSISFVDDIWNIALYIFVCPTYVALSIWVLVFTIKHWSDLHRSITNLNSSVYASVSSGSRLALSIFVMLLICTFFITVYIYDILNPNNVIQTYWFMTDLDSNVRTLNRAGYYYIVLNFTLLFITLLSIFAFFSISIDVMRFGDALDDIKPPSIKFLRSKLDFFTTSYFIAKILAVVYMINAFIWKYSPLGKTSNLVAAGLGLTFIGVFFISIPRLYVELRWYQYKLKIAQHSEMSLDYEDIRPFRVKILTHVADLALIGSFLTAFWEIDLDLHAILLFFKQN